LFFGKLRGTCLESRKWKNPLLTLRLLCWAFPVWFHTSCGPQRSAFVESKFACTSLESESTQRVSSGRRSAGLLQAPLLKVVRFFSTLCTRGTNLLLRASSFKTNL
jgi:hypothetical protein